MSVLQPGLDQRLERVRERFEKACLDAQRSVNDVTLIAVGKTFPISAIEQAWALGQRHFGENYVQEGVEKIAAMKLAHPEDPGVWHFIGPLQSNKTRLVAENFDWMHTIDRLKIAERLSLQRPEQLPDLNVLIEVNISGEATKSGVLPESALDLAQAIAPLPHLRLRGLMAIPAPSTDPHRQAQVFRQMKALFDKVSSHIEGLDTLSMGMSADMAVAIAEGSTMVRIGSAIFGPRDYGQSSPSR